MCNVGCYSLIVFLYWLYMFQPNRPSSGVQVVVIKEYAAHCNAVLFLLHRCLILLLVMWVNHLFYLGVLELHEPTFVVHNRKVDLTLGNNKIGNLVSNWHISDEPSLSGHRYIRFHTGSTATTRVTFRNSKRTNWESYKDNLKVYLEIISWSIRTIRDTDLAADQLQ
jgi:hypothetical protein